MAKITAKSTTKKTPKKTIRPATASMCEDDRWRAEEDMRTLRRAAEIKADPNRLGKARKVALAEMQALKNVAGSTRSAK